MTWKEIKGNWWHRLAIALILIIPFILLCLDEPEFAIAFFFGLVAGYRIILWIVLGKIDRGPTTSRRTFDDVIGVLKHSRHMTFKTWMFLGLVISFGPVIGNPSWESFGVGVGKLILWTVVIVPVVFLVRTVWLKIFPRTQKFVVGTCGQCEGSFEFPDHSIGETILCPHCQASTLLVETSNK